MSYLLSPLGGAGVQFLDNSGNPLAGGFLYTYVAGSTTPQATYTTSAGTAHQNPIEFDPYGRVPSGGELWLLSGTTYKFVLKTSVGVTIGTYDNINGIATQAYLDSEIADGVATAEAYTDSELADFLAQENTWPLAQTMTSGVTFPSPAADTRTVTDTNLPYYEEGTFTATVSAGLTTTPATTWRYVRTGNSVTIFAVALRGTSDGSSSVTVGTIPTSLLPVLSPGTSLALPGTAFRNGVYENCVLFISDVGVLSFNLAGAGSGATGTNNTSITYALI